MKDRGMGTYFVAWLTQSPDTPPGSGSKTPSQRWRSVRWNRLVHIYHTLDSGTGGSGAARLARPSQVITPPGLNLFLPTASTHQACSRHPGIVHVSSVCLLSVTVHTRTNPVSFPFSSVTAACVPVQQGASNLPASLSLSVSPS